MEILEPVNLLDQPGHITYIFALTNDIKINLLPLKLESMKTIFDRIILFSLLFIISFSLQAQDDTDREIGIRFANFTNFGLIYKKKKAENKYRRFRLANAGLGFNANQGQQAFTLNTGVAVGIEKRKELSKRFHFITGTEFLGNLNVALNQNNANVNITTGVGFVLGFQYAIKDRFYINLETIPSVNVLFGFDENGFQENLKVNAGFNSNAAALSLVYQFKSKKEM